MNHEQLRAMADARKAAAILQGQEAVAVLKRATTIPSLNRAFRAFNNATTSVQAALAFEEAAVTASMEVKS